MLYFSSFLTNSEKTFAYEIENYKGVPQLMFLFAIYWAQKLHTAPI